MDEGFFDRTALGIGAVQDGIIVVSADPAVDAGADAPDDRFALSPLTHDLQHLYRHAVAGFGPQLLVGALWILGDDGVGSVQNVLGAAVILLQFDDRAVRIVAFKVQDIAEVSAAPAINDSASRRRRRRCYYRSFVNRFTNLYWAALVSWYSSIMTYLNWLLPFGCGILAWFCSILDGPVDQIVEIQRGSIFQRLLVERDRPGQQPVGPGC